ncbi:MAG: GNAT family N-acetyltransferase [Actinomycetota bacterium]|nr:GNAT family N-acetyltransferase [Actinomycetota bacterium]
MRITASANYTSQQIEAWAPVSLDASACAEWVAARASAQTIVAVVDTRIAGFSDLMDGTLLDMLYVDPDVGGRGVGSALIARILALARGDGAAAVETYASLTARPLFERHGFTVIEQRTTVVRNIAMTNFKMRRVLDRA